ncbi:MAG: ParB/RepB/Spo0J family partition protein [Candidatus Falkowbacteria bacterium]
MSGLGRGLGSLIPSKITPTPVKPVVSALASETDNEPPFAGLPEGFREHVLDLDVDLIRANTHQPRQDFAEGALADLAESIREHGILQPLVVIKRGNSYELVAGERRLRASKLAGLTKVPAIVRDFDEQKKMELALIENIQREDLNPMEVAHSLKRLSDEFNLTQESLSKRLGKARPTIANSLRLLTLPSEIQRALSAGMITEGHAKILLGLESPVKQLVMFKKIVANKMSVADTSTATRKTGGTKQAKVKVSTADSDNEAKIREYLGAKTEIKKSKQGGQIVISFFSDDELEGIIKKITKK